MGKKIILTISIIISNNLSNVKKCLNSIKPILDSLPSELILTDTGCDKETREVIESYTNNIIDFKWCNDFSAARNVGLAKARGQWFMWIDDDEWFEDVDDIIHFFKSGEYKEYDVALYYQRNYMNLEGTYYEDNMVLRMVRLKAEMHFEYSIHEVLAGIDGEKGRLCKSYANHYGYVMTEDERTHKAERNLKLLLSEKEKRPGDLHIIAQLLQCYEGLQDWSELLQTVCDAKNIEPSSKKDKMILNTLCVYHIHALYKEEKYELAIKQGEEYLENKVTNLYNSAGILKYIIPCYYETSQYDMLVTCVRKYLSLFDEFESADGKYNYQVTVSAGYISNVTRDDLIGYGIRGALRLNDIEEAKNLCQEYNWGKNSVYIDANLVSDIITFLPDAENIVESCKLLFDMTRQKDIADYVIQEVSTNSLFEHLSGRQTVSGTFAEIMLYAIRQDLEESFSVSSREVFEYWNGWMKRLLEEETLENLYWNVTVCDWKLVHIENEISTMYSEKIDEISKIQYALELFANYAELMILYCNNAYDKVNIEQLKENQQAAFLISDLICAVENNSLSDAISIIRKIIKMMPRWKYALEYLPKWISIIAQG